jgi:hypothetical protein
MFEAVKNFRKAHANIFEFIMFNLLSNIATITNFAVLNISKSLIFAPLAGIPFSFLIFKYPVETGGLGGFLAFLLSYASAQAVNFVVQRKLVFGANNKLSGAILVYIVAIIVVYLICLYVPSLVIAPLSSIVGDFWAANLANALNIFIQVVILYPVLKFVVMKKTAEPAGAGE